MSFRSKIKAFNLGCDEFNKGTERTKLHSVSPYSTSSQEYDEFIRGYNVALKIDKEEKREQKLQTKNNNHA